jgi:predicted transcriptional regulator YheO
LPDDDAAKELIGIWMNKNETIRYMADKLGRGKSSVGEYVKKLKEAQK